MSRPQFEIADVIEQFGQTFYAAVNPNDYQRKVLRALSLCRTAELGYHKEECDCCGEVRISYNSCRNRHCPKCQGSKQLFWVEDLLETTLPVKHYHIVFTVPHELNTICMLDSAWFYGQMFASVWDTLRTFGYTKYGVETGAVCVLHTWGQNLSLHPHIHCIVPAAGETFAGNMKHIAGDGKFIFPQGELGKTFRGKLMESIKRKLKKQSLLLQHQSLIDTAWGKNWVVDIRPSFGKPEHVVKYLGQYTHRVAITNQRLLNIDENGVTFMHKNYNKDGKLEPTHLPGVEFLRRFACIFCLCDL
jgi:Putative transposase/Transposase zinc-binding domain